MAGQAKNEAALRLTKKADGFEVIKRILGWVGYKLTNIEKKGEIYYATYIAILNNANTVKGNYDALDILNKSLKGYALIFGTDIELEVISAKVIASHYEPFIDYMEYLARCYTKGKQPISVEEFNRIKEEEDAGWRELDKP